MRTKIAPLAVFAQFLVISALPKVQAADFKPGQLQVPFTIAEHEPYQRIGTATLQGQIFMLDGSQRIAGCPGSGVTLLPATNFLKEFVSILLAGGKPKPPASFSRADRKYLDQLLKKPHQVTCAKSGTFSLSGIPAGQWLVVLNKQRSRPNANLMASVPLISIEDGQAYRFDLTDRADGKLPDWHFLPPGYSLLPSGEVVNVAAKAAEEAKRAAVVAEAAAAAELVRQQQQSELAAAVNSPLVDGKKLDVSLPLWSEYFASSGSFSDSSARIQPMKRPTTFGPMTNLQADIAKMLAEPIKKTEWESDAEYRTRIMKFVAKYQAPRGYKLVIKIDNPKNLEEREDYTTPLAFYDLDAGELVVRVAEENSSSEYAEIFQESGEAMSSLIAGNFLDISETTQVLGTYRAQNAFGASVTVSNESQKVYGVYILSGFNWEDDEPSNRRARKRPKSNPQVFRIKMDKTAARQALTSGSVVLNVALEVRFWQNTETPLLFHGEGAIPADMKNKKQLTFKRDHLPVRLISFEVRASTGSKFAGQDGTEVDATALGVYSN